MNKTELKTKWGAYTDTDKLVDDICALLTTYHHRNTEHGVCIMLDTYFERKEPLIKLFMKSDKYVGDMRIVITKDFERNTDTSEINSFCRKFPDRVGAKKIILSTKDEHGKTFINYLMEGLCFKHCDVRQLMSGEIARKAETTMEHLSSFGSDGISYHSKNKYDKFTAYMNVMRYISTSTITQNDKDTIEERAGTDVKIGKGLKTSRAFNKICAAYHVDTAENYNSLFAEYADMVSAKKRSLDFVISLNPYDYLTMSFGKSWSSCHTIDKTNQRGTDGSHYHGMHCAGTMSYMLDASSIITFVIDKGANIQECGKIYRTMFHYQNNTMVQGRVYPQGNDGSTSLYEEFRDIMISEMSKMLEVDGKKWTVEVGTNVCGAFTHNIGNHYPDFHYRNDCAVCYPEEYEADHGIVHIGSLGICTYCGAEIDYENKLAHDGCL
jgi:hypothetical protein